MGKWAIIFVGGWWLLHKQVAATTNAAAVTTAAMGNVGTTQAMANPVATTAADPFADYTEMNGACRANPASQAGGRDRTRHEITHASSVEECSKFCNVIKPCWGIEFDTSTQHFQQNAADYGNCEIWKMKIATGNNNAQYKCYKKTVDPTSTKVNPTVSADFKITNLNLTAMQSNSTLLASLAGELFSVVENFTTPTVMSLASNPEVKKLGSDLMIRLVFTPVNDTSSVEVHNYVRLFASNKKRVHTSWNQAITTTQDPGVPEKIADYFEGLPGMTLGSPVVTMEMVTFTPLAAALNGDALALLNNPGGGNNPGGSSTTRTTASSGYVSVPSFFLLLLCLTKM